jgi:hypothetical protein
VLVLLMALLSVFTSHSAFALAIVGLSTIMGGAIVLAALLALGTRPF